MQTDSKIDCASSIKFSFISISTALLSKKTSDWKKLDSTKVIFNKPFVLLSVGKVDVSLLSCFT